MTPTEDGPPCVVPDDGAPGLHQQLARRAPSEGAFLSLVQEKGKLQTDNWKLQRENAQLKDRVNLLGERLKQLEGIVRGAFARAVRGLSGDRPAARQDADAVVRIVEDHYAAETLLKRHNVHGSSVERSVQILLDRLERVVEVAPEPRAIVVVHESEPPVAEVGGSYSLSEAPTRPDHKSLPPRAR